jgi:hypothetical protein
MEDATVAIPRRPPAGPTPLPLAGNAAAGVSVAGSYLASRLLLVALTEIVAAVRHRAPLDIWNEWDGRWYLGIAAHGYHWSLDGKPALAFFPLYPFLVHAATSIGLPALLAGILISNVAFVGALFYLYAWVAQEWNAEVASRSVWLFALFPTALFTFAPYTESLFLLCAAGSLYHAKRRQWLLAGCWAALAVLARSTGIIILPALLAYVLLSRETETPAGSGPRIRPALGALGGVLVPPAVAGCTYLWYLRGQHRGIADLLVAQRDWHRGLTFPWTGFAASLHWLALHAASNLPWAAENVLQLTVALVFLGLTIAAWRGLNAPVRAYCAAFWALVLLTPEWLDGYYAPFSSMDRMVLVLLPLVAWLGWRLTGGRFRVVLAACATLQAAAAAVYLAGGWVG